MPRASFLILHGLENHRPPAHWQFWLAASLAVDSHAVRYPSLPEADAPVLEAWTATLVAELVGLREDAAGGERVVVAHSLSCLLWLRAAPALGPELRPDRVLLVSPPDSDVLPASASTFRLGAGPAAFDAPGVLEASGALRFASSDRDPYDPGRVTARYAAALGAGLDTITGAGHITPDDGYGPWPSVRAWCDDGAVRLVARG